MAKERGRSGSEAFITRQKAVYNDDAFFTFSRQARSNKCAAAPACGNLWGTTTMNDSSRWTVIHDTINLSSSFLCFLLISSGLLSSVFLFITLFPRVLWVGGLRRRTKLDYYPSTFSRSLSLSLQHSESENLFYFISPFFEGFRFHSSSYLL